MESQFLTGALRPTADCPSLDDLGRFVDGAMSAGQRATVAAHVDACQTCQSEIALLHSFAATAIRDDEAAAVRDIVGVLRQREHEIFGAQAVPTIRRSLWFAIAPLRHAMSLATALLFVVVGYYLFNARPPSLPANDREGGEVTRSLSVALRSPIGDQAVAPQRLEWSPVAGAARYRVRLLEVDRHELWSTETADTAADLPGPVRAQIVPAKTVQWQVTAFDAAGAPIAESSLERFRLAPP